MAQIQTALQPLLSPHLKFSSIQIHRQQTHLLPISFFDPLILFKLRTYKIFLIIVL